VGRWTASAEASEPSRCLPPDDFKRHGRQSAEGNALAVGWRRSVGGLRHSLGGDVDDQVAFQAGLGFGGIAVEHDFGSVLTQLEALWGIVQFELDLGQEIVWKGRNVDLKAGGTTGGNCQEFRGSDFHGGSERHASSN
jgi:hypothetical protein